MSGARNDSPPRVAIVGGGLAGLAAAVGLAGAGAAVELFESRRRLGGRATSYRDPASGERVDHCQHVSMGCCTNLADFARRVGIEQLFRREPTLHFFGPDGTRYDLRGSDWAPAPGHLGPALARLGYLSLAERAGIARAMWRMLRDPVADDPQGPTAGEWLRDQNQSPRAIEQFWSVVLVSALSETADRASLFYARKVFVDGFMSHRSGYVMEVPAASLDELYGTRLEAWLSSHDVTLRLGSPIGRLQADNQGAQLTTKEGITSRYDYAIVALPWHALGALCDEDLRGRLPELKGLEQLEGVPITGVHLWFDKQIMAEPHAVLVQGLCQWVFQRPLEGQDHSAGTGAASETEFYYQVVISASRDLAGRSREDVLAEVCTELGRYFPAARNARLLRGKIVTEQAAVFSPRPGVDRWRPRQQSSISALGLAGDWTATGWPATMEGAVRSGYLAAEAALRHVGREQPLLVRDLPERGISRLLIRRNRRS